MKNVIGSFEETIEQGAHAVSDTAKKQVTSFAKTVAGQIVGNQSSTPQNDQGTNEVATAQQKQMSDDQAKQFLKDLYGPTKPQGGDVKSSQNKSAKQAPNQSLIQQAAGITPRDPNEGKKPEEIAHMQSLRNTLHQEYYQNLTNPQKPEEESVTEKLEQEEQVKQFEEIEKQKKKPDPLATVKKGTGENMVGVSG